MTILEARGVFWWASEPIPATMFAPESSVAGLLKIEDSGGCSLELDGTLPNTYGRTSPLRRRQLPEGASIQGLLKGSAQCVFLTDLAPNGHTMSMNGISFEQYLAATCLLSASGPIPSNLKYKELTIPLFGYEEWLRLGTIGINVTPRTVSAKYKRVAPTTYKFSDESLTIEFNLQRHTQVS